MEEGGLVEKTKNQRVQRGFQNAKALEPLSAKALGGDTDADHTAQSGIDTCLLPIRCVTAQGHGAGRAQGLQEGRKPAK